MSDYFSRTRLIIGDSALNRLKNSRVAVFGIGGVGGHTAEALVRSGIGAIDIIDKDVVSESNINRQIIATVKTIGRNKVDVAKERFLDINPELRIRTYNTFFTPATSFEFDFTEYDYVVDAIDTVTGKLEIITKAYNTGTPVISAMGAGNKLEASAFEVADIFETSMCPLARVMRSELKKRGVNKLKVVYSKEPPLKPVCDDCTEPSSDNRKPVPGSVSYVPSVCGLLIAGEVIKDLINTGTDDVY